MTHSFRSGLIILIALLVATPSLMADPMVTIDHVDGLSPMGNIPEGSTLTFHIRFFNDAGNQDAVSNGYQISGEGYDWTTVSGVWNPDFYVYFDFTFVNPITTGSGADTIGFAALCGSHIPGLPADYDDIAHTFTIGPITRGTGPLVVDSSFWYPANYWLWGPYSNEGDVGWGGPYEYEQSCCTQVADINQDGRVDALDLMYLVEWMWMSGPEIPCPEEANVDGNGQVDAMDLAYFVEWLWAGGPAPVGCNPVDVQGEQQ